VPEAAGWANEQNGVVTEQVGGLRVGLAGREEAEAVKSLVVAGLTERWQTYDPTLNPDLDRLDEALAVVIAVDGERVVGSGRLDWVDTETVEVRRMATATDRRNEGIARLVLDELCGQARAAGAARVVSETEAAWTEAVALYRSYGFTETGREQGRFGIAAHFALDLKLESEAK